MKPWPWLLFLLLNPSGAQAGEVHRAVRWELGLVSGCWFFPTKPDLTKA
jgi:hypothetical protein